MVFRLRSGGVQLSEHKHKTAVAECGGQDIVPDYLPGSDHHELTDVMTQSGPPDGCTSPWYKADNMGNLASLLPAAKTNHPLNLDGI